jgi:hypothetical protein
MNPACAELDAVNITANGFETDPSDYHPPADAIDKDDSTWWSNNEENSWVELDLGQPSAICGLGVEWNKGDTRDYSFKVEILDNQADLLGNETGVFGNETDVFGTGEEIFGVDDGASVNSSDMFGNSEIFGVGDEYLLVFEGEHKKGSSSEEKYPFEETVGQFIKLTVTSTSSNDGWVSIKEIRPMAIPT